MILYIAILSIFLSVLVAVRNWKVNQASLFISVLLLLLSIFILHQYAATDGGSVFWMAVMYNNFAYPYYLCGPLIYWYTRSLINDEVRFSRWDLLHLVPVLIHFAGVLPYILTTFEEKKAVATALLQDLKYAEVIQDQINWVVPMKVNSVVRNISIITYTLYSMVWFVRHLRNSGGAENTWKGQGSAVKYWYFIFTGVFLLLGTNNMIAAIEFSFLGGNALTLYSFRVVLTNSILIAGMPMALIAFPHIIYGLPRNVVKEQPAKNANNSKAPRDREMLMEGSGETSHQAGVENTYFTDMAGQITRLFEEEKPHLKADFSIEDLADRLKVPRHHLYFCLNSVIGKKFIVLKNHYRILHAQQLLLNIDMSRFTIDSIGLQSGFASRSNFYSAFKEVTGITPTEYLSRNGKNGLSGEGERAYLRKGT